MGFRTSLRWLTAGGVLLHLSSSTAPALLKFNEGRDQLFATVSLSMGYDSNIFADSTNEGDIFTNTSLSLEYLRHAGLIAVNGSVAWNLGSFASNPSENFANPSLNLEFVKQSGRTTGSLAFGSSRQSQADPVVNQRIESWNHTAGLNWKYPVITRYSFAGSLGYGMLDYIDESTGLVDLETYSASTDLYYTYSSQRDLVGGYRFRLSETSGGGQSTDHSVTAGVSGKILAKLKGVVRGGYQIRKEEPSGATHGSITAAASATWAVNKRFSLTGTLNKDFSTTATDSSVDNLSFNLDAQYAIRHQWALHGGVGVGQSEFLSGVDRGREDYYFTWNAGVSYTMNDHFKASLTYSYFQNWSNRSGSDFDRHSVSLNLTSRW